MSSTLRVGIIGLGVGSRHAAGYAASRECEIVALCDRDVDKLAEVAADHPNARLIEEAPELLDDPSIDIVSIASYDSDHFEYVKRALERGKHVFCEKPLCLRAHQADELYALADSHPELRLSSNLPLRRSPRFQLLKRMIDAGEFGTLYYLEADYDYGRLWKITEGWRSKLEYYSVVLGGAIHVIDLLLWLTGDRVVEVTATGSRLASSGTSFRFNDLVVATLVLASGVVAKVGANFACAHPHYHDVKIFGTEATFVNGLGDAKLYKRHAGGLLEQTIDAAYPGVAKGDQIPPFVSAVRGEGNPDVTAEEVFDALAVCFAIDAAVESRAPVPVVAFRSQME